MIDKLVINVVPYSITGKLSGAYDGVITGDEHTTYFDRAIEQGYRRPVTLAVESTDGNMSPAVENQLARVTGYMRTFFGAREPTIVPGKGLNIAEGDFQFQVRKNDHQRRKAA